jgi:GAF domain-containing protein
VSSGRTAVNADPAIDLGMGSPGEAELRSCVAVPLVEQDALVGVLGLYSSKASAFTDDHERLLDLLAPRLTSTLVNVLIAEEDEGGAAASPPPLRLVRA